MAKRIKRREKGGGTLVKRGNIWYARWVVDGKTISKSTGTTNKREAEERLKGFTAPFKLGSEVEALEALSIKISGRKAELEKYEDEKPALKVTDTWDAFVNSPERSDISQRTLDGYKSQWNRFEKWAIKRNPDCELRSITQKDAGAYASDLTKAKLTANTFNIKVLQ